MLKGNLSSFSLGEIFQSLAINNHTGTLRITTKDRGQKCIYFSKGEISLFSTGSPEALRIGEILIRQKKLAPADLTDALEEQKQTGELLGKILIRKGFINKDDIREALETKIREEVYDLFLVTEAEFEFHVNHLPEEIFDTLQKNTRIAINTSAVIMEGLRRVDEWRLIQRRIKTFDEIFVAVKGASIHDGEEGTEILPKLDGATPVSELFQVYSGSRFDCSKVLYELVESGRIRAVTIDEAISSGNQALGSGDLAVALRFFRFADQIEPTRVEALRPLWTCLTKLNREQEAAAVLRRLIRIYSTRGMHEEALELAEPLLLVRDTGGGETAEIVFRAALALGRIEAARAAGNQILSLSLTLNDLPKAEEVLEELTKLNPRDLNLRIELAEICAKGGNKSRAISHLESVSAELQSKKKYKELIKVMLLIFEIDPGRQDVKQKIQKLLALQERQEKLKKQRVGIAGGSLIVFLLLLLLPLTYELKARELYSHAQRLEEISMVSNNFIRVKAAYEEVLRSYSFSSRASRARLALDRVSALERIKLETMDGEKAQREKIQREKLQALREALPDLLREAKRYEDAGEIQGAFDIYTRISTEFADVPGAKNVLFPIQVTSQPKGALVEVNGVAQGATPVVLRAQKGQELTLVLTRSGCQPAQEKFTSGQKWKVHFHLNPRPIGEMKLSGAIHQPMDARGERIYFPSRDGFLYAVAAGKKEVAWQRRMGRYGDLVSELGSAPDELLLGTVNGEVAAVVRANGKARWKTRLGGTVLAPPVLSPDSRWVAAVSIDGEVGLFDYASGELKGGFVADDEVLAAPAFAGDVLLVGSMDHHLYELAVPDATPRSAVEFPGGVTAGLTPFRGTVVFGTSDGAVHRYAPASRRVLWTRGLGKELSGPPAVDRERVYVGTLSGEILAIDGEKGEVVWSLKMSTGRVGRLTLGAGRLFAGAESGDLVAVMPATGAREWSYKADAAISAPPLLAFGRLYVPCTTGKILVMEVLE